MLRKLALLAILLSTFTLSVKSEELFGLTADSKLIRFDSASPDDVTSTVAITGLQTGESLLGIDFRPLTGKLYALGNTSRLYTINPTTGAATQVGTGQFTTLLSGTKFGFDFNPNADRIRVVSDNGQNLRLNPDNGLVVGTGDPTPVFATNGLTGTPALIGAAYANNVASAGSTTLYVIDSTKDALFIQDLTTHSLTTVGQLGLDVSDGEFDISGQTGIAYAAFSVTGQTKPFLFTISLLNGSATPIGAINSTTALVSLTAAPVPVQIGYSLNGATLRAFLLNAPGSPAGNAITITGAAGQNFVGIDFRPATGQLYGVTSNNNFFRLYTIDLTVGATQGVATQVGADFVLPNTPTGRQYDIDFNPTVDRIRLVCSSGTNARLNPDTAAIVPGDLPLVFATGDTNFGDTPNVSASAYTNNFAGATTTTLYDLDAFNNALVTQSPPNNGALNTVGLLQTNGTTPSTVNLGNNNIGFDIAPDGRAYATLNGIFYQVNLATGAVIQVGDNNGILGSNIREFAIPTNGSSGVGSPGTISFSASSYSIVEGQVGAITLTRSGGSTGTVSVFVNTITTNGNAAVADVDYVSVAQTVTFSDGETSRTVFVEALTDSTLELFETATIVLSNPVGCSISSPTTATIVIIDVDDLDGDGFTNAEETAAGSSPTDASSTPFGGAPAGVASTTELVILKATVKLNFTRPMTDTIALGGTISNFPQVDLATLLNQKFVIDFGGVVKSLPLGPKGVSLTKTDKNNPSVPFDKNNTVKITAPKSGITKLTISLKKGDFGTALTDEGLANDPDSPTKAPRTVALRVLFNGKRYEVTVPLLVTIKAGKGSSAVKPKS